MASSTSLRPTMGRAMQLQQQSCSRTVAASRTAPFSTTAQQHARKSNKDNNKKRGVSSLYRSGPREHLSMSNVPLPQPRLHQPKVNVDPNHGLWGFFPAKGQAFYKPSETEEHGRAWTVEELRSKGFNELHALWWVCCRERNMLATSRKDMIKARIGFGEREIKNRDAEVWKTMNGIRHTLSERYYAWQDAVMIAEQDPEINLQGGEGNIYNAAEYHDALMLEQMDEEFTAEELEANAAREAAAEKAYAEKIGKSYPEPDSELVPEQPPKNRLP